MNPHDFFDWLFGREQHQDTGWSRERKHCTDEVVALPPAPAKVQYPLHQPAKPATPDMLANHQALAAWLAQQPVLHQRYVEPTKTGPTHREMLPGCVQEIQRQHAPYQPPLQGRARDTEGMARVVDKPNLFQQLDPDDLPDFLRKKIPNMPSGALPVQCQAPAISAPLARRIVTEPPPAVDNLPTFRPEQLRNLQEDRGVFADIPTAMPRETRAILDLPPPPPDWPEPPVLADLPVDAIAATDRTATPIPVEYWVEPEVTGETPTLQGPAVRERMRIEEIIKQMKESE